MTPPRTFDDLVGELIWLECYGEGNEQYYAPGMITFEGYYNGRPYYVQRKLSTQDVAHLAACGFPDEPPSIPRPKPTRERLMKHG